MGISRLGDTRFLGVEVGASEDLCSSSGHSFLCQLLFRSCNRLDICCLCIPLWHQRLLALRQRGEAFDIVLIPQVELEILCRQLDVDEEVHELACGDRLWRTSARWQVRSGEWTYRACTAADDLVEGQGVWDTVWATGAGADGLLLATLFALDGGTRRFDLRRASVGKRVDHGVRTWKSSK